MNVPSFNAEKVLQRLLWGTLAFLAFGLLERIWWIADLFAHLRPFLAIMLVVCAFFFLWKKNVRLRNIATGGIALAVVLTLPPLLKKAPIAAPEGSAKSFSVYSQNIAFRNENKSAVIAQIRESDADIVLLQEVTAGWIEVLKPLLDVYQFDVTEARETNFGMMLMSKFPIVDYGIADFSGWDVPSITATIDINGEKVAVIGTHPPPPVARDLWEVRNWHLESLAQSARLQSKPLLVIGDLNATPWSAAYQKFVNEAEWVSAIWPGKATWKPLGLPFVGLPTDYQLVSEHFRLVEEKRLGFAGSDHRAMLLEFALAEN
ncbi:MAG: endonuclease/exonuclease/phosphatase family protein [Verrucomicrobiota bacterium]